MFADLELLRVDNLVESVLERKKIGSLVVEGPAILKKKLGNYLYLLQRFIFVSGKWET